MHAGANCEAPKRRKISLTLASLTCLVNLYSFTFLAQKCKLSCLLFILIHIIKKEILLNLLKGSRRKRWVVSIIYFTLDHFFKDSFKSVAFLNIG